MKRSLVCLALIRSPTQNVGMGLVVKLQIMQQLTTLVISFLDQKSMVIGV